MYLEGTKHVVNITWSPQTLSQITVKKLKMILNIHHHAHTNLHMDNIKTHNKNNIIKPIFCDFVLRTLVHEIYRKSDMRTINDIRYIHVHVTI